MQAVTLEVADDLAVQIDLMQMAAAVVQAVEPPAVRQLGLDQVAEFVVVVLQVARRTLLAKQLAEGVVGKAQGLGIASCELAHSVVVVVGAAIVAVNGKASEDLNNYTQAYEKDLQQVGVQRNDVVTVAQADVAPPVVPAKKGKNPPKVAKKKLPVVPKEAVTTEKSIQAVQAKQVESKQVASAGKAQMEGACRDPNLADWAPLPCPNV